MVKGRGKKDQVVSAFCGPLLANEAMNARAGQVVNTSNTDVKLLWPFCTSSSNAHYSNFERRESTITSRTCTD